MFLLSRQSAWNIKTYFMGKKEKYLQFVVCLLARRVFKFKNSSTIFFSSLENSEMDF